MTFDECYDRQCADSSDNVTGLSSQVDLYSSIKDERNEEFYFILELLSGEVS